jgi:hypothetical protein
LFLTLVLVTLVVIGDGKTPKGFVMKFTRLHGSISHRRNLPNHQGKLGKWKEESDALVI